MLQRLRITSRRTAPFFSFTTTKSTHQFQASRFRFYSTMAQQSTSFKLGMCQLAVTTDKATNINNAIQSITAAVNQGAQLVVLPECFNCPYGNKYFSEYAEELETSETLKQISAIAKQLGVYVIAGSIPTRDNESGKLFNTCTVFDREGNRVAVHNKVHLFDISIPDQITFKESDSLTAGDTFSSFEFAPNGERVVKVGLGICFDIRFPEMAQIYTNRGCELLVYPGAFNMTTGPAHWELLCRARAVDNQLFVCVVSPARDTTADYVAYGHSMAVDPWGRKLAEFDEKAGVLVTDVEIDKCQEIRQQIPRLTNKRSDLYIVQSL